MKKRNVMKHTLYLVGLLVCPMFWSCSDETTLEPYVPASVEESTDPIDIYFNESFLDEYGTAVRWKWDDKNVATDKRVTPALRDVCIPMGDFILDYWISPFTATEKGAAFFREHFPPEIVFVGSPMYNSDGASITLGYADAGVRITFTQVNQYDLSNRAWVLMQLRTAEHEFSHIVHQKNNLPNGYKDITPSNYKSNNWINMAGDVQAYSPRISREAIIAGMVSNYGASDVNEDFCEIISIYLTSTVEEFNERYITHEPTTSYDSGYLDDDGNPIILDPADDAVEMNEGRDIIAYKLKVIKQYYMDNFEVDLDQVRDDIIAILPE